MINPPDRVKGSPGSWQTRRMYMFMITLFNMAVVTYVLIDGLDTRAADTAVLGAIGSITACLASYVFGAVWHDKNLMSSHTDNGPEED